VPAILAMKSKKHRVMLDPDGSLGEGWMFVIVSAATGVEYHHQCGGVACDQRSIEGYLVPVDNFALPSDRSGPGTEDFTQVFHHRSACRWGYRGSALPAERLEKLKHLVQAVPFWRMNDEGPDDRLTLKMDHRRLDEVLEAYVPVVTPDGPGVLLWENCD
jgi:Family of unknown function (DUF6210)